MESIRSIKIQSNRINVIDALRGFALLGVILIHMLQYFGYSYDNVHLTARFPILDKVVQQIAYYVIAGRFINIFSFLFGLSFFIQMDRASKKGVDFRGRFLWRMVILFFIGLAGTIFTYMDILTIYAFFGIILVMLFPLKNRVLITITAIILLGLPLMTIVGFDNITLEQTTAMAANQQVELQFTQSEIMSVPSNDIDVPANGSFFEAAKDNLT